MTERGAAKKEIDFEPARLRAFLAQHSAGAQGEPQIERIGGGQSNPTYFITVGDNRMVLRKRPNGDLPKSAHDVLREYRILRALTGSAVPVPEPILACEDEAVIGTPFYLMKRLDGRIFHDQSLSSVPRDERRSYFREFARTLAALHSVNWAATDLAGLARPGRYLERQVERWSRAWGAAVESDPDLVRLTQWLRTNIPPEEDVRIVHGDYKFNNVIFDTQKPCLIGVLDWELCAIGDPLCDVAHVLSALWETRPDEYAGILGLDLEAHGLPSAEEFIDYYYEHAPSKKRVTPFHLALAHFRNAGIFHGIGERVVAGTANAADAASIARFDRIYVRRALDVVERNGG
jgi:aminoglycoside phosphotransferase (APT) family kinase protein